MMPWDNLKIKGHDFKKVHEGNMLGTPITWYKCFSCNVIVEHDQHFNVQHWRLEHQLMTDACNENIPSCADIRMNEALGEDS